MTNETDGFAMADTLVALIISALFSTSLILLGQSTLRTTDVANARFQATLLARALIETKDLRGDQGEATISGKSYAWQKQVTPTGIRSETSRYVSLHQIEVTVSWPGYQTRQSLTLKTHRLGSLR